MHNRLPFFLILSFTALWCTGIYIAPIMWNENAASIFYSLYHSVCHQIPDHSFHIGGSALAVCARCTAIYTAFFLGIIALPFIKKFNFSFTSHRYFIIILASPMVVDVAASWTTGYSSTITSRVVSGGLFGFGAALLLAPIFIEGIRQLTDSKSPYSLFHKPGGSV